MILGNLEYLEMGSRSASYLVIDLETGEIEFCTPKVEKMFHCTVRNGLIGGVVEQLLPERFRDIHARHRAAMLKNPIARAMGFRNQTLFGLTVDGVEFPVAVEFDHERGRDGRIKSIGNIIDLRGLRDQSTV